MTLRAPRASAARALWRGGIPPRPWTLLGDAHRLAGRCHDAIRAYEKGLRYETNPALPSELLKRLDYARCLQEAKQKQIFNKTRVELLQAVKDYPKDEDVWYGLALASLCSGFEEDASKALATAIELWPEYELYAKNDESLRALWPKRGGRPLT